MRPRVMAVTGRVGACSPLQGRRAADRGRGSAGRIHDRTRPSAPSICRTVIRYGPTSRSWPAPRPATDSSSIREPDARRRRCPPARPADRRGRRTGALRSRLRTRPPPDIRMLLPATLTRQPCWRGGRGRQPAGPSPRRCADGAGRRGRGRGRHARHGCSRSRRAARLPAAADSSQPSRRRGPAARRDRCHPLILAHPASLAHRRQSRRLPGCSVRVGVDGVPDVLRPGPVSWSS